MPLQLSLFDSRPASPEAPVVVARGPRAAEALLLDEVDLLLDEAVRDPALLASPIRIVVPSRSLREHVAAALVARRGRAAAGVIVQTLYGLACEVLARAGDPVPRGALLFDLLAQRFARGEPSLARPLDGLVDGYGAVAGAVRDLLDAGLTAEHADAAEEALAEAGPRVASRHAVERARALVRVAARVDRAAARLRIGRAAHLFRRAVARLAADPDAVLPARAVRIHGFADATGVATDLLGRLLKRRGAKLVLDRPPDPARPDREEVAFTERLSQALAPGAQLLQALTPGAQLRPVDPPAPSGAPLRFAAPGVEAEVREAAVRIGALLDAGAVAERIGVVMRDPAPFRRALRRHFGRLGIPFSGVGERGSSTPAGRWAAALLDLLEGGAASPCDRWLDALVSLPTSLPTSLPASLPAPVASAAARRRLRIGSRQRVDLRLAIRALGAGRLADLADFAPADLARLLRKGRFLLPIRQGLRAQAAASSGVEGRAEGESAEDDEAPRAERGAARSVDGEDLARARAAAAALAARFAAWPAETSAAEHLARLAALLREELGWSRRRPELAPVYAALEELAAEVPAGFPLTLLETAGLLRRTLAAASSDPLGGAGGGVQTLSVTEARGRTFERLFVLGLNRDLFPRTMREDPLLPDALRAVLRGPGGDGVLPDVPIKAAGFDEERYLFAQLLAAALQVTLSWRSADDDGRPLAASPLLARAPATVKTATAPHLYAAPAPAAVPARPLRPAFEEAILAGIHADRSRWRPLLPAAIAEARAELGGDPGAGLGAGPEAELAPAHLAAARLAVLDELDPDRRTAEGRAVRLLPGPYFGFVGGVPPTGADPRHRPLYVTAVEAFAACPWQTFVERLLEVEPTPDPLEVLPGLEPLLVGNLVHAVLDEIVRLARGDDAAAPPGWEGRAPVPIPWPEPAVLAGILRATAERLACEEGIALRGLARALAARAEPFLAAARDADWGAPAALPAVLGAELLGQLEVAGHDGRARSLHFKADRVDAPPSGSGGLVLTDYKTGKPFSQAKTAEARRRAFLRRVQEGRSLQAVAYQLGGGPLAVGRYLFLRPELDEPVVEVRPEDVQAVAEFRTTVAAVLAGRDGGAFFPRLVDPAGRQEPARCRFCRVAEACLRGDSGARSRLLAYAELAGAETPGPGPAFAGVWRLAQAAPPARDEGGGEGADGGENGS